MLNVNLKNYPFAVWPKQYTTINFATLDGFSAFVELNPNEETTGKRQKFTFVSYKDLRLIIIVCAIFIVLHGSASPKSAID